MLTEAGIDIMFESYAENIKEELLLILELSLKSLINLTFSGPMNFIILFIN